MQKHTMCVISLCLESRVVLPSSIVYIFQTFAWLNSKSRRNSETSAAPPVKFCRLTRACTRLYAHMQGWIYAQYSTTYRIGFRCTRGNHASRAQKVYYELLREPTQNKPVICCEANACFAAQHINIGIQSIFFSLSLSEKKFGIFLYA